jgi:ketosteroid isomerase-like protein
MLLRASASAQMPTGAGGELGSRMHDVVVSVADSYRLAMIAGDARAVAAVYGDDGVELPPHHPLVRGRAAIEDRFRHVFEDVTVTAFTFTHLETTVDGHTAYDAGAFEQQFVLPSGRTVIDRGKHLAILERANGEWKSSFGGGPRVGPRRGNAEAGRDSLATRWRHG